LKTVEEWEKLLWTPGVDMGWPEKVAHKMIRDIRREGEEDMQERCAVWINENVWNGKDAAKQIRALKTSGDDEHCQLCEDKVCPNPEHYGYAR